MGVGRVKGWERLARRIRLGEDSSLELRPVLLAADKVKGPDRRDLADGLAAMANGRGGTVVLGGTMGAAKSSACPWIGWTGWSGGWRRYVSYAGERHDGNYRLDARDIGGPLDHQIFDALHFARRNMLVRATKTTGRVDRPQFSDRAVFEALANAVAHRDYSMGGARIRFHMFADRIELHVPGALSNTLTTDSMHLRQYSRNELIVSLLARCPVPADESLGRSHIMDRRGDGVPVIRERSRELSGRMPDYELIDDSELRLVIWGGGG